MLLKRSAVKALRLSKQYFARLQRKPKNLAVTRQVFLDDQLCKKQGSDKSLLKVLAVRV